MTPAVSIAFDQEHLFDELEAFEQTALDAVEFGVIGFDANTHVTVYNEYESQCAGLAKVRTIGKPLFTTVAPCMNNYLVAQRFEDALLDATPLDCTIDYVLTLKMRPVKVKLRLLAKPALPTRYVLVNRQI